MRSTIACVLISFCTFVWAENSTPDYSKLFDRIDSLPAGLRENQRLPKKNQKIEAPKDLELLLNYLEKCVQSRIPDSHAKVPKLFDELEKVLLLARDKYEQDEQLRKEIRDIVGGPDIKTEKSEKAFAEGKQTPSQAQIAYQEAKSKKETYLLVLKNRIPFSLKDNFYLKLPDNHWAGLVSYLYACDQAALQPRQRSKSGTH
jgi:hypothetical protein